MFRTMQNHTRPAARLSERGHHVRAPHLSRRALTATAWSLNMHQVAHTMTVWDQAARAIQYGYRRWVLTANASMRPCTSSHMFAAGRSSC